MDCVAHQAPLSMGFSKQEYWSGLLFPTPGKIFFNVDHFFKSLYWICYNISSVLCFDLFGHEACGILAPRSEIETASSELEGGSLHQRTAREVPADVFLNHHVFANGWSRGFLNKRLGTQPYWSETRLPVKSQRQKWSGLLLLAVWWTRFSAGSFCYKQWHAQRVGVRGTKMVGVVYSGGERYLSPPPFRNAGVWW